MPAEEIGRLLDLLAASGRTPVGPMLRGGVLVYGPLADAADLPAGLRDVHGPGKYRCQAGSGRALFAWHPAQDSWKRFLYPSEADLLRVDRGSGSWELIDPRDEAPHLALFGVRPCELAAIRVQDAVLLRGPYADPLYRSRREAAFIVAVNCTEPGGTCFCASMGSGPRAGEGCDLIMTELDDHSGHRLVVEPCSEAGAALLAGLDLAPAGDDLELARELCERAAAAMGRELDPGRVSERLAQRLDSAYWQDVAGRCLGCGNCTMVCPTCFCCTVEDWMDLDGHYAGRKRLWDSCFAPDHSYIHGGDIRTGPSARYRQWLTHKLLWWPEQYGLPGCVGCGRCITWCPVGIDITREAAALIETASEDQSP